MPKGKKGKTKQLNISYGKSNINHKNGQLYSDNAVETMHALSQLFNSENQPNKEQLQLQKKSTEACIVSTLNSENQPNKEQIQLQKKSTEACIVSTAQ